MSQHTDFLLEIGTEELPTFSLLPTVEQLAGNLKEQLISHEIIYGDITLYCTPRRLAVLISKISVKQPAHTVEKRGPSVKAAYDKDGKPTKALEGFARSNNTDTSNLVTKETDKGSFLFFIEERSGEKTIDLLPDIITSAVNKLSLRKPMRWRHDKDVFLRPVHWIIALFGSDIVDVSLFGKKASNISHGHRFHHPKPIKISKPSNYEKQLEKSMVIANFEKRKQEIKHQITKSSKKHGVAVIDETLLDEVTGLTEWPIALTGSFDEIYLSTPKEAIICAMKTHQKCFPIIDKSGTLTPHYITISNIDSKNKKRVIAGNNRVIRARLADAKFFYDTDMQHDFKQQAEKLNQVVFQEKLGSVGDKTKRVTKLAVHIAKLLSVDEKEVEAAAQYCKVDLVTDMVGEFHELQGVMGSYYAKNAGFSDKIAAAIKEHYQPRYSGDALPSSTAGCCVSLADKLDTLTGILGINLTPTGDKDPFALRRKCIGIIRIVIENKFNLDIKELLRAAIDNYSSLPNNNVQEEALNYIQERMRSWYLDQNIDANSFAAVAARHPTKPFDFHKRLLAVKKFQELPEAKALAAANKRVSNILRKQANKIDIPTQITNNLLTEHAEKVLSEKVTKNKKEVAPLYKDADYISVLTTLASLQTPLDDFFDKVMVMTEDEKIRNNRLALLKQVRNLFLDVADISLLQ